MSKRKINTEVVEDETDTKCTNENYFEVLACTLPKKRLHTKLSLQLKEQDLLSSLNLIEGKTKNANEKYTLAALTLTDYYKRELEIAFPGEEHENLRTFALFIAEKLCFMLPVHQDKAATVYNQLLHTLNIQNIAFQGFNLEKYLKSKGDTSKGTQSKFLQNCLPFLKIFENILPIHFADFADNISMAPVNDLSTKTIQLANMGLSNIVCTGAKAKQWKKITFLSADDVSNQTIGEILQPQYAVLQKQYPELKRRKEHSLNAKKDAVVYYAYETDKHDKLVQKKFTSDLQIADDEVDTFCLVQIDNILMNIETDNFFGTKSYISKIYVFDESNHTDIVKAYKEAQRQGEPESGFQDSQS